MKCKVKEDSVTKKARWWFVLHNSESMLCELEEKWPQVNLQTSWKLEPCYKPIDSLSPGSDSCPSDNTIPASSANSATSTIVELSIHDNAGKDNVSIIDNSTIVCTSPEIPPPNQSEPTDASLLSSSHEQSGSSFLGASRGNTPHSQRPN